MQVPSRLNTTELSDNKSAPLGVAVCHVENLPMGLNVHSNLLRLIRDGRGGERGEVRGWVSMSYHLLPTLSPAE